MGDETPVSRSMPSRRKLLGACTALAATGLAARIFWGLRQTEPPVKERAMGWRLVFSQWGRGTLQTESFLIDTGQWRIKWSAKNIDEPDSATAVFRVGVHSAVSGRLMSVAVDRSGAGEGVAYVAEEPRPFFLSIESEGLEWTVQVDEGSWGVRE